MKSVKEFFSLLAEYNLLPIVLFFLSFEIKNIRNRHLDGAQTIQHDGYEFLLIEIFAHFSLLLRVISAEGLFKNSLGSLIESFSALAVVYLILILILWWVKYAYDIYDYTKSFRLTFYNAFFSWCVRIIILGFFSRLFLENYISAVACLIILFILWHFFKIIIVKNFIRYNTLLKELNLYSNRKDFKKAEKVGSKLLSLLKNKQGQDIYDLMADAVSELGVVYCRGKGEIKNASSKGIELIEWFLQKDWSIYYGREDYQRLLIMLYCNKNDIKSKNKAISLIKAYLPENEQTEYISYVNNNECWKIVLFDQ